MFIGEYSYADDLREHCEESLEIGREEGREEGVEIGMEKGRAESVRNLFDNGMSVALIAKLLRMPVEKVEEFASAVVRERG